MAPAETPDDPADRRSEQLRRRMKAARALADLTVEQLADRIGGRGLGAKTLYNIERGERPLQPREVDAIARACGVPPAFFTVDLDEALDDRTRRNERIDALEREVADLARTHLDVMRLAEAVEALAMGDAESALRAARAAAEQPPSGSATGTRAPGRPGPTPGASRR